MKKRLSVLTSMLLTLVLMISMMPAAMATEQNTVDPANDKGEIAITLKYDERPLAGISVTLYRVATGRVENYNLYYDVLGALGPVELNGLNAEETAQATTALVDKIKSMQPDERELFIVETVATNEEGVAKFEDLPVGVYLAVQSSNSRYTFSPVLMYLPFTNDEGTAWDFAVTANPKVSYHGGGGGGGGDTPPPIIIPPDEPPLSPPDNPPDDPYEEIPEEEPPLAVLPQTGLLQWPSPVMAMGGLLLIALGLLSEQKRKAQNN